MNRRKCKIFGSSWHCRVPSCITRRRTEIRHTEFFSRCPQDQFYAWMGDKHLSAAKIRLKVPHSLTTWKQSEGNIVIVSYLFKKSWKTLKNALKLVAGTAGVPSLDLTWPSWINSSYCVAAFRVWCFCGLVALELRKADQLSAKDSFLMCCNMTQQSDSFVPCSTLETIMPQQWVIWWVIPFFLVKLVQSLSLILKQLKSPSPFCVLALSNPHEKHSCLSTCGASRSSNLWFSSRRYWKSSSS